MVHPATGVLYGEYNETCAPLGQVPKIVVVSTCSLSRTAIRVLSLWCSGCCQIHIVYVSGPLSKFHLNNPYI
jgi:hypothetical protein